MKKIFIAKGRAKDNPLILHVSDKNKVNSPNKIANIIRTVIKSDLLLFTIFKIAIVAKYKQGINNAFNLYSCKSEKSSTQIKMLANCIKNTVLILKFLFLMSTMHCLTAK